MDNPFGGSYPFGFLKPADTPVPGYLYWFRLNAGAFAMPGAFSFQNGSGQIIRTTRNLGVESGYLDVMNGNGDLIWSAKSASRVPRVRGFIDLPANSPVDSQIVSFSPGFNPWILMNMVPGNISDDGESTGYSGLLIKWTGSEIQVKYTSKYQKTFSQSFGGRGGLKIPYAYFQGY
ncbi:hypothetical protein HUZ42_26240 (plasmid) [Klebsiella pneumoniae]|nr:hypothetical protein HUZ42_26240 [Klebsiella pneumoniae]